MRFTLAQLEAFYWTCQFGSVNKAARHLHVAQPTISLRLRQLETALEAQLFQKAGRGLAPTPDGHALLPRAAFIVAEANQIAHQSARPQVSGSVKVGFAEGFAMVCLPAVMDLLRTEYPLLRPEFVVSTSSELERELGAHRLDVAVLVNPVGQPGLRLTPLGAQETGWVAGPRWGLPDEVRPTDLRQLPIVTNPPPSAMFRQIKNWFATGAIEPQRLDFCSSVALIAHLVTSGVAVGVLPKKVVERELANGHVRFLRAVPDVESGKVYVSFPDGGPSPAIGALLRCVQEALAPMDYLAVHANA